jgi:hypothetical protein
MYIVHCTMGPKERESKMKKSGRKSAKTYKIIKIIGELGTLYTETFLAGGGKIS